MASQVVAWQHRELTMHAASRHPRQEVSRAAVFTLKHKRVSVRERHESCCHDMLSPVDVYNV